MYLIRKGTPIQRLTSDGHPLTDTVGKPEHTDIDYELYPESVLLWPDKNDGKWLFAIATALLWEVEQQHVKSGSMRSFHATR